MIKLDPHYVRKKLKALQRTNAQVFGADEHEFKLNPPLAESELRKFEERHGITLPHEYRTFIADVGNGGAGPYYGVFPLGFMDASGGGFQPLSESGIVGELANEFTLREAWNDLTLRPPNDLAERDEQEYWRQMEVFENEYFSAARMNGAMPICHMGCALRVWLVVTGEQRGRLWRDGRADDTGISPILLNDGSPATFVSWYMQWLEGGASE